MKILISRTDSIGDLMLSLPMALRIKQVYPEAEVGFLVAAYTLPVAQSCLDIDFVLDYTQLQLLCDLDVVEQFRSFNIDVIIHALPNKTVAKWANRAAIPKRIGTSHRWFHWFTCNRWVHLGRKNSSLHEFQLNLKLLEPLSIPFDAQFSAWQLTRLKHLELSEPLATKHTLWENKLLVILHPKSKGSAREWPMENYRALAKSLDQQRFQVLITGTASEGALIGDLFNDLPHVTNLTGALSLRDLMALIRVSFALVACSTGPLHIAAAYGIHAIGLFPPIRPMHPGRWAPQGQRAKVFVLDKSCSDCRKSVPCHCIAQIPYEEVARYLKQVADNGK